MSENISQNKTNTGETFAYTYSAKERDEVRRLREKYAPAGTREETALERLRRLDRGVTKKAAAFAIPVGVLGALLLGCGMSLFMTELGTLLGLPVSATILAGAAVGAVGILLVALAYPIYRQIERKERARIAPEILALTETLLSQ